MNLVVDVGNSAVKLAVFDNGELIEKIRCEYSQFSLEIENLLKLHRRISACISSNVGNMQIEQILEDLQDISHLKLSSLLKFPFTIKYKTPETLGVDRLALTTAAFYAYPNKDVLVIDAGTCITFDFINSSGQYLGGSISPGLKMRYQSLNHFTAKLPLLTKKQPESFIGQSTVEAIHVGVVCGTVAEIDGMIQRFTEEYPYLTVILTGGDSNFLSNQLKNSIFANSNFLLEGLNHILDFNRT
ncbi:type III pantothenate kinase [Aegicerativicinus sediminis]|uniref:type III pantothenate kinase n=1 Tax=Aegicerativicinus sediminis TaxID=2893202 RepID=UPI001E577E67|nr:type III pantothenate kinase [Aegicerativicinus sediminis]